MKRLSAQRLAQVNECLREVYRAQDLDEFAETVPVAISRLIGADIITLTEINLRHKRVGWHYRPADLPLLKFRPVFERWMHTDPIVRWYSNAPDGRAMKMSDLVTRSKFHAMPIYAECYRELKIEHQLAFTLDTVKPLIVGVALNRFYRDFSEEDRLTANLLRAHLMQAYHNAEALTRARVNTSLLSQGIDQLGRAVILASRDRKILQATEKARCWLASYLSRSDAGSSHSLPTVVDSWLEEQIRRQSDTELVAHLAAPLLIKHPNGTLVVRAIIQEEHVLLLLEEQRPLAPDDPAFLAVVDSLGLGRRESQVLAWVTQGKTNPEIALILGVSARTIQTHLDRIYRKLDVQSRAAAVAKAMEARALAAQP